MNGGRKRMKVLEMYEKLDRQRKKIVNGMIKDLYGDIKIEEREKKKRLKVKNCKHNYKEVTGFRVSLSRLAEDHELEKYTYKECSKCGNTIGFCL